MERWKSENIIIKKSEEYEYLTEIEGVNSIAKTIEMEIQNIYEVEYRNIKNNSPKMKFNKWQEVENLLVKALKILEDE